jgi:hypothetical protein
LIPENLSPFSKSMVVVTARQATYAGEIDSFESILASKGFLLIL